MVAAELKKILVTGASGFVGTALCRALLFNHFGVRAVVRSEAKKHQLLQALDTKNDHLECVIDDNLQRQTAQIDTVVHLAARVHRMQESAQDLSEYHRVNVIYTENIARAAAANGVRRFIFLSSIKVNGEFTLPGQFFTEQDNPMPQDPYAQSKWEAEQKLMKIAEETGMEMIIIRPPLVYGAGVKANFKKLVQLINRGWPLPLGCVQNRRSFIYLENLVDAIIACIRINTITGPQTFLVSDGEDISTPELIRRIAVALNKPARIWPVPLVLMNFLGKFIGKQSAVERLLQSLQIDNSKICHLLNWHPPYTMQAALQRDFMK